MTYTVIARCERTGDVGIACATYTLAVGQYCDGLVSRSGITMSQASVRQINNSIAVPMLANGAAANDVMAKLLKLDNHSSFRQIGVIDARGDCAVHTGKDARDWKGHRIGQGVIAMGNVLTWNIACCLRLKPAGTPAGKAMESEGCQSGHRSLQ